LLIKQIFPYLDILIVFDFKIYYLKIEPMKDIWIIHQICLLEEIPDVTEFKERINHYTRTEGYEKLNKQLSVGYLINIQRWMHIYQNFMGNSRSTYLDNLYDSSQLHPDADDLIKVIPILIKQLKSSSRKK